MKTLLDLRKVVIDQYRYTLSIENKVDFIESMTKKITPIPLIQGDEMLIAFENLITPNKEYYDTWLNFCFQVITELEDGAATLNTFLTEYNSLLATYPGSDAFNLTPYTENPHAIILLALRVYLEVLDKGDLTNES